LTRLPGDSTEAYAWATWSDIDIDLQSPVTPLGDAHVPPDGANQEQIYTFPAAPVVARPRPKKKVRGVNRSG
jgi:hypothetical protein